MTDNELRALAQLEKEAMEVPETVHRGIEETLASLPEPEDNIVPIAGAKKRHWKLPAAIAAAFLMVLLVLPNTSYTVSRAMSNLPVLGTVFDAVTFRDYEEETGNTEIAVKTPEIKADDKSNEAAPAVSREIDAMNEAAVKQFKREHANGGYGSLDIYYDVAADTDRWYTVRVTTEETGADGFVEQAYYSFDKKTGNAVILSDLFEKDAYIDHISDNIKEQMRAQMKKDDSISYFLDTDMPEEDFKEIDPNQDFYFDKNGDLVICFDEMEVAPAYMGPVSFTVPQSAYAADLHPEYK